MNGLATKLTGDGLRLNMKFLSSVRLLANVTRVTDHTLSAF